MFIKLSIWLHFFCVCIVLVSGLHLPSYIKPCKPIDANFKECALKNANEAIPSIVKGDRVYGVPSFYPYVIPFMSVEIAGFGLNGTNVKVTGIPTLKVTDININLGERRMSMTIFNPLLTMDFKYKMSGKLLSLPIKGDGQAEIRIHDAIYKYDFSYKIKEHHEKRFLIIDEDQAVVEPGGVDFHLDNLFNGDKTLGDQLLKFLNENWKEVFIELGPPITVMLRTVFKSIVGAFMEKIPIDEIFPENGA